MKSIFKKTLVAAAVLSASAANAATVSSDDNDGAKSGIQQVISSQGLAIRGGKVDVTATQSNTSLRIALNPDVTSYTTNDTMKFTFVGATVDTKNTPISGIQLVDGAGNIIATGFNVSADAVSVSPDTTAYAAALTDLNTAGNAMYYLTGVKLAVTDDVTVSYAASRAGEAFDSAPAVAISQLSGEYAVSIKSADALNGVIDVEKERKQFTTANAEGINQDSFKVTVANAANIFATTRGNATVVLKGERDLNFLKDKDGKFDKTNYSISGTEVAASAKLDGQSLTVETNDNAGTVDVTLMVPTAANKNEGSVSAQGFTADVEVDYSLGGTTDSVKVTGLTAGKWTLSGKTVNMPYLPFGAGISPIVYLSNSSSVDGDIELTAFDDEGQMYGPVTLSVSATGKTVTSLGGAIREALTAEGFDGVGKLDVTLVINSPSAAIDVFGAYNVRGDRLAITVQ